MEKRHECRSGNCTEYAQLHSGSAIKYSGHARFKLDIFAAHDFRLGKRDATVSLFLCWHRHKHVAGVARNNLLIVDADR